MVKKTKWFTIFEMIIVIWIIWMILSSLQFFFNSKRSLALKQEACLNYVYWKLNNVFYQTILWKWVADSWEYKFPETYIINFDVINQTIKISNKFNSWSQIDQIIFSWWLRTNIEECNSKLEVISFSWDNDSLIIQRSPVPNLQFSWQNTKVISEFLWNSCVISAPSNCKIINKISIDKRTLSISQNYCKQNGSGGVCLIRTK
jgi:hypothetical protein